jgi:glutamate dehydrogenase/leucine dehydrogenase
MNLEDGTASIDFKKLKWTIREDEPMLVKEVDLKGNNRGWLVIDSLGDGHATGGIRFGGGVSLDEVQALAAEMTLKFSFLNLPLGGAKAGIYNPYPLSIRERDDLFLGFGKALGPLLRERIYLPGTDMGTYPRDIDQLLRGAGAGEMSQGESLDSGYYTAVSVFSALQAIASVVKSPLPGARIGIQGLGKVGLSMVELAFKHRLKVVASSSRTGALYSPLGLDIEQIVSLAERYGDDLVLHYQGATATAPEELFEQDLDILCPCAGLYPIHPGNLDNIKAKIIVSGCNVTATSEVEDKLFARGISYLPGFVCNSGGVLCYHLSNHGFKKEEISKFLSQGIRRKVTSLLLRAKKSGESPCAMAHRIVKQKQERFTRESEAMLQGKLRMAAARFKSAGVREMMRTGLWPLVRGALSGPPSLRRRLARRVLFERLFLS